MSKILWFSSLLEGNLPSSKDENHSILLNQALDCIYNTKCCGVLFNSFIGFNNVVKLLNLNWFYLHNPRQILVLLLVISGARWLWQCWQGGNLVANNLNFSWTVHQHHHPTPTYTQMSQLNQIVNSF